MIYVTGDCHTDFKKFNRENFPEQSQLTKDDYVIICGDFGGVWDHPEESPRERYNLDILEKRSFTILFVGGNHENFDRLYDYPVEEWKGGKIHRIRPSIYHLMKGQVLNIDGNRIFTFGGAQSHDISAGVLDRNDPDFPEKREKLDQDWIFYRILKESWWEQELPSEDEMQEGLANLQKVNFEVDYIITHCCATRVQDVLQVKEYLRLIKKRTILMTFVKNVIIGNGILDIPMITEILQKGYLII